MIDRGTAAGPFRLAALALLALAAFAAAPARAADEAPAGEGKEKSKSPLEHVSDSYHIELFESFGPSEIVLPHVDFTLGGRQMTLGLSKFMLLELIAAALVVLFYYPLAHRLSAGELPRGWQDNAREVVLTFIRDEVAKPAIQHDTDKYVPFIWTMFLFILFNNLLGLIPFCGSPTGNIFVTLGLALCVFFAIHGSGIKKMGFKHYIGAQWPHIDVPFGMGYVLKPLIFCLEWLGILVRNAVLAVRLFANMFAGHVVLATILIFIYTAGHLHIGLWGAISILSVLGQVALSLLELFVAFLQAYIFTFLAAIFMGLAMDPGH